MYQYCSAKPKGSICLIQSKQILPFGFCTYNTPVGAISKAKSQLYVIYSIIYIINECIYILPIIYHALCNITTASSTSHELGFPNGHITPYIVWIHLWQINQSCHKMGHKCFLIWGDWLSCDPLRESLWRYIVTCIRIPTWCNMWLLHQLTAKHPNRCFNLELRRVERGLDNDWPLTCQLQCQSVWLLLEPWCPL